MQTMAEFGSPGGSDPNSAAMQGEISHGWLDDDPETQPAFA